MLLQRPAVSRVPTYAVPIASLLRTANPCHLPSPRQPDLGNESRQITKNYGVPIFRLTREKFDPTLAFYYSNV